MQITIKGRVTEIREGKQGESYVTMLDVDQGGMCKVTLPPGANGLKVDALLDLKAIVKPGVSQYGLYLKVVDLVK
jgi:hypothetical protein